MKRAHQTPVVDPAAVTEVCTEVRTVGVGHVVAVVGLPEDEVTTEGSNGSHCVGGKLMSRPSENQP